MKVTGRRLSSLRCSAVVLYHIFTYIIAAFGYNGLVFRRARNFADRARKPLLNVGCKSAYTKSSDINLDIEKRKVPRFVRGDIQDLTMFDDKEFGAVYASHVLEHVDDPDTALKELHRVSENVFIITPLPIWPWSWLHPDHKWIMWGNRKLCRNPFNWKDYAK